MIRVRERERRIEIRVRERRRKKSESMKKKYTANELKLLPRYRNYRLLSCVKIRKAWKNFTTTHTYNHKRSRRN